MAAKKGATKKVIFGVQKIQDDVPIPQIPPRGGKYPVALLQVGSSFLFVCSDAEMKKTLLNIKGAARRIGKREGREFLILERPEEGGVRCWRLDDPVTEKDEESFDLPEE